MYAPEISIKTHTQIEPLAFKPVQLSDKDLFESYLEQFQPVSCEYSFSNLFAWRDVCHFSWTMVQDRILIYNGESKNLYMPLGEEWLPQELVLLSLKMQQAGYSPDITLCLSSYLEKYPEISNYYRVESKRENAEYLYDVNHLADLKGPKLHKKRNLISQFKRAFPEYEIHHLAPEHCSEAFEFSRALMNRFENPSLTIQEEFCAIERSFENFTELGLEGLVIRVDNKMVAFSVFSRLNPNVYDIHFEKADIGYKGAAQLVNQETAKYLTGHCEYLNREQDLGIKGLRQAKMSYDPHEVVQINCLQFNPLN